MNIFLTGNKNTGKSTVINGFLQTYSGSIGGFKTVRQKTQIDDLGGIYILDISKQNVPLSLENRAGSCTIDRRPISYEYIFETVGVKTLTFKQVPDLIIMDELGILENGCTKFRSKVVDCLKSKADVLGVLKNKSSDFLNEIRARKDVTILNTADYSDAELLAILKEYLC